MVVTIVNGSSGLFSGVWELTKVNGLAGVYRAVGT